MNTGSIRIVLNLPYRIRRRKHCVVACCPSLDVCSQGDDADSAKKNLAEALAVFVKSCFERGVLEDVLKESGFKSAHIPSRVPRARTSTIDVPLMLTAPAQECRA